MKTYKCIDCGNVFGSEEIVEQCSQCGSDNITPIKKMPNIAKGLLIGLLGIPLGFGVGYLVDAIIDREGEKVIITPPSPPDTVHGGGVEVADSATIITEDDIPQIIDVTNPQYKNGGYYIEVKAIVKSKATLIYELSSPQNTYTSEDGKFENIAYTDDGIYHLTVKNVKNGAYVEDDLEGFKQPVKKVEPLTKAQIQHIIDTSERVSDATMAKFGNYHLDFIGLAPDEPAPVRFREVVQAMRAGSWKSATIIGEPKYDELGRVTYLKIRVEYYF